MIQVHAVGNHLSYHKFHYPIRMFHNELYDKGVCVHYFKDTRARGIYECDLLIFYEDNYRKNIPITNQDRKSAVEYLEMFFSKFKKVIWFDGYDGSGWLRSYIFPLIDIYAKSHLLVNTNYYREIHSTGLVHRDYVIENHSIPDPLIAKDPLNQSAISKLRVSWNNSLKNWRWRNLPVVDDIVDCLWKKPYRFNYTVPNLYNRSKLVPYRVNYWKTIPTVTWWRERTRELTKIVIGKNPPYYLNPPGRVSRRQFNRELRNSVVTISPFGLGEDSYRDFESFINGSLLFKPSMAHQRTWPDLYMDGETYISHAWDFSDYDEKLSAILQAPQKYEEVAREGQNRFRNAVADGETFVRHFLELIS